MDAAPSKHFAAVDATIAEKPKNHYRWQMCVGKCCRRETILSLKPIKI
jgi:hypothetical protein